jgi:gliding motility-associated lipoprotein GldH
MPINRLIKVLNKIFYKQLFFWGLAFLFFRCAAQAEFEENKDIEKGKWEVKNTLSFIFEIKNAEQRYNLFYNVRNNLNYPFYNLYITYYLEDSKGKLISSELQNITLLDAKTGQPFGSGLGDTFAHQLSIPNFVNYKFPQAGRYTFKIKQYMRQDPLPGIVSFGLRVEKAN